MPRTLTRAEFKKLRPQGRYERYLDFVRRKRAARNAWRTDPFAQIPESHIQRIARSDVIPSVSAQQQAIEESIERRSRSGIGQIRGFTDALMQALAPYDARIAGYYGDAQASTAAIGNALRSSLAGGGAADAAELGGKLAAINAPEAQVNDVAGGARRTGEGAAGATFGLSSADLERLAGERTAHGAYAAKQPGIAALSGLQSARALELALSGELADRVGELRAGAPGLISQRVQAYRDANFDRALAGESRRINENKLRQQYLEARAKARTDAEKAALDRWYKQQTLALRQGQLAVSTRNAETSRMRAQADREQEQLREQQKRADAFYEARDDAFTRARSLKNPSSRLADPVSRDEARQRLWQEFGRALVGRGWPRSKVIDMIEAALRGAGYKGR